MNHGLISEQPKSASSAKTADAARAQESADTPQKDPRVNADLFDDRVAQAALFGTLAAMMVMVYKAGTA
ncbi:hypothetical protein K458DRAFT_422014 [Lentithecium fluviatile CBS 122367]|uniref:Uncharacterized protein n=1 Tax=Lentithecium fluviatile CBS 122367 TaxID=1168545 RepID=A0A6G1IN58_9PLEO|nr:hypothetical protein K458DRAFT_422014 [Lentithecium fluviatile CBS 122367]